MCRKLGKFPSFDVARLGITPESCLPNIPYWPFWATVARVIDISFWDLLKNSNSPHCGYAKFLKIYEVISVRAVNSSTWYERKLLGNWEAVVALRKQLPFATYVKYATLFQASLQKWRLLYICSLLLLFSHPMHAISLLTTTRNKNCPWYGWTWNETGNGQCHKDVSSKEIRYLLHESFENSRLIYPNMPAWQAIIPRQYDWPRWHSHQETPLCRLYNHLGYRRE